MASGFVTLVGAGPGDAGLLTLRGRQALERAQVVLYDRLVGEDILAFIPPEAETVDVGKRSGAHPVPQGEICALLLEKAREGRRVVRLKGGDPYLFGRGGEEAEALAEAGVPFEVVPGVTSAVAAPACAGIPLTHRGCASSVHIVTGHAKGGSEPDIPYAALAAAGGTLVFLMGVAELPDICAELLCAGMDPVTPAALVENGTLPQQRKLLCTLAELPARTAEQKFSPPCVLVVGEVCSLSERLDRFPHRPLSGTRVLVTCPREAGGRLGEELRRLGCAVTEFPTVRLAPVEPNPLADAALEGIAAYQWIVFTSAFGAGLFCERLLARGQDARALAGIKIAAVGPGTAAELRARGIVTDLIPGGYNSKRLAEALLQETPPGARILLYRSRLGEELLPQRLREAGRVVDDLPAYDALHESRMSDAVRLRVMRGEFDCVAFTSASTVSGFRRCMGWDAELSGITALCIGGRTAEAAREAGMRAIVSREATIDGMVEVLQLFVYGGKGIAADKQAPPDAIR